MEAKKRNLNLRLPKSLKPEEIGEALQVHSERRQTRPEMSCNDLVNYSQDLLKHLHNDIQRTSNRIRELNSLSPDRVVRTTAPSPVAYDYPDASKYKRFMSAVEFEK